MNLVRLTDIRISPNRQRREFEQDALNELRESIQTHSLLSPPILREESGHLYLVAGERRLRALTDLYDLGGSFTHDGENVEQGYIPYVTLGELDELEREEAELEENIRRKDLTWQEKAMATARLSTLRTAQATLAGLPPPTHLAIALEIKDEDQHPDWLRDVVKKENIVSQHLHKPEVAAAKNVHEAFKILQKEERTNKNRELGISVGKTFSADSHTLLNEDAIAWLEKCPDNSFDVILTDPPYGMGADEFGDSGGKAHGEHGYADDEEIFLKCSNALIQHGYRITKPEAHLYVFCDLDNFSWLRQEFKAAGWWVHRTPLIWYKTNGNRVPWPQNGPQRKYELILYAVKGKKLVNTVSPDILPYPSDKNLGLSAQKPLDLLKDLLSRSIKPGDTVCDPFMGTGATILAVHNLKCTGTGIEIDAAHYGIAVSRLQEVKA